MTHSTEEISCIRDGITGICRDLKDKKARQLIEELRALIDSLTDIETGTLATDEDIQYVEQQINRAITNLTELISFKADSETVTQLATDLQNLDVNNNRNHEYINQRIDGKASEEALAGKVDKSNTADTLYGVDNAGNQANIPVAVYPTANTVAKRVSNGTLQTAYPLSELDATNKAYVDNLVGAKANVSDIPTKTTDLEVYWETILTLTDISQITRNGLYHVENVSSSFCANFIDYGIGDFMINAISTNWVNGRMRFGTLQITTPRTTAMWLIQVWEYVPASVLKLGGN